MSNPAWTWKVNGSSAVLSCGPVRATAIVHEKGGSIALDEWKGEKTRIPVCDEKRDDLESSALVALTFACVLYESESLQLAETYVRGSDFVASFTESGHQRVAPQIYWRAEYIDEFHVVKIELIASVRTSLLDSESVALVHGAFNSATQVLHAATLDTECFKVIAGLEKQVDTESSARVFKAEQSPDQLFIARFPRFGLTYAQMVHPTDFHSVEAASDGDSHFWLSNLLFSQQLEKGVIRRARVCGWFMPLENDLETAVKLARQFVDEPLPLTA